ncbi:MULTISPECIES: hypothetical protein [unclassified Variovorax]|uniref:hypothetical protein n=1 Tax=unclassified Variovorax TaxID=663243 RepID=UPI003F47C658
MALLLNWRAWVAIAIAAALAFSHFTVYRAGRAVVRQQWDRQIAVDAETARKAADANRAIEAQRQTQVLEAQNAAKTREAGLRTDLGRASAERGRLLDAIKRATGGAVPSSSGNAKPQPANPIADVLGACTAEVQELAGAADGHASDVQTLESSWPKR